MRTFCLLALLLCAGCGARQPAACHGTAAPLNTQVQP